MSQPPMTVAELASRQGRGVVGLRWVASGIDSALCALALLPLMMLNGGRASETGFAVWLLLVTANFVAGEATVGRTLGKRAIGLRVVDADGNAPGWRRSVIRNLLRLVEANPILGGGVIAAVIALASKRQQRLGDMLAGTYVITDAEVLTVEAASGNDPDLHVCESCGTPYRSSSYRPDVERIFCSACKAEIRRA